MKKLFAWKCKTTIEASSAGSGGLPRFTMVAYTGVPMNVTGWDFPLVVDLDGIDGLDAGIPAFAHHNPERIVGHIVKNTISGGELVVAGVISGVGPDALEVAQSSKNGFPWQASIGADPIEVEFVNAGDKITANGKEYEGPIYIAKRVKLSEISFVPLGADSNTSAKVAAKKRKGDSMNFDDWCKKNGFDPAKLDETQKQALMKLYEAENGAGGDGKDDSDTSGDQEVEAGKPSPTIKASAADPIADYRRQQAEETKRIAAIRAECKNHPEIEAKSIAEGWTLDKTKLEVIYASHKPDSVSKPFSINTGKGFELSNQLIAAAACKTIGIGEKAIVAGLNEQQKSMLDDKSLGHMRPSSIVAAVAHSYGIHASGFGASDGLYEKVLRYEKATIQAGSSISTLSLTGILGDVANKAMLDGWGAVDSVLDQFTYSKDVDNFQGQRFYRLNMNGAMQQVGQSGELKSVGFSETEYTSNLDTHGGVFAFTRKMQIDDNLNAFAEIPRLIGQDAPMLMMELATKLLLDNSDSFFSTANGNIMTGTSSALSCSSLETATQKFLDMKVGNRPIPLTPDRLMVGSALKATADRLYKSEFDFASGLASTSAKSREGMLNVFQNTYKPFVNRWMSTTFALTGSSNTKWFMLTDPGRSAPLMVTYLRGNRTPTIRQGELDINTLGIGYQFYFDFGVAKFDPKSCIMSDGV